MNQKQISARLFELSQPKYKKFTEALIPCGHPILGVRMPLLRQLGADVVTSGGGEEYLKKQSFKYHEELLLQGIIIGRIKVTPQQRLKLIADYIPRIDSWAVCDCFCGGLKFTLKNKADVWAFLQPYLKQNGEYPLRFAIVMLLGYFIDSQYIGQTLKHLAHIKHDAYYVNMAIAWALSVCYVKFPNESAPYIKQEILGDWVYRKTLQKIRESRRAKDLPLYNYKPAAKATAKN